MFTKLGRSCAHAFAAAMLCLACVAGLTGCTILGGSNAARAAIDAVDPVSAHVVVYQGSGAIGFVDFMAKASEGKFHNQFRCVKSSSAGVVSESFRSGKVDIAVVPTTLALNIYHSDPENTQVASISSLGVLHVVSARNNLHDLDDLAGETILITGANTMYEFVMRYLLVAKGLEDQVTLEFVSSPINIVASLSTDHDAIGVMAEPYVTAAHFKDKKILERIDLSQAWAEEFGEEVQVVSSVVLVRADFAEKYPEAVAEFLAAQEASVSAYDDDPDALAQLVADGGYVDSVEIAEAMLPTCEMTCITGEEMHKTLSTFLQALYDYNSSWIGGSGVPEESFYYVAEPTEATADEPEDEAVEEQSEESASADAEPAA